MDDLANAAANTIFGLAGQQERPLPEPNWPEWMRQHADHQRAKSIQNVAENPALWKRLNEIETKLNEILARLPAVK